MEDDPIGDGLAVAIEEIEEHGEEERYSDPALAAWIQSVSMQMLELQTFLSSVDDAGETPGVGARLTLVSNPTAR